MTYRALFPGKLIEFHASTGSSVSRGGLIARVRWFDESGRPTGDIVEITSPTNGTVETFVAANSQFLKGEPLFRLDPDGTPTERASGDDLRPILNRALVAAAQGNWPYTEQLCRQVLDAHPTDPGLEAVALAYRALALGFAGYKEGNRMLLDEALIGGRRAVRIFQQTKGQAFDVSRAYEAIGNAVLFMITLDVIRNDEWPTLFPEGYKALKRALEVDPESTSARKNLGIIGGAIPIAKMRGAKL